MSIEAMKQMVAELEYVLDCINNEEMPFDGDDFHEALRLGRQAIAEAEKHEVSQEPVGWIEKNGDLVWNNKEAAIGRNLYTHPQPKREWVGLNWDDLPEIYVGDTAFLHGAKWAEAKLKDKNGF